MTDFMKIRDIVKTYGVDNIRIFTEMDIGLSLAKCGMPFAITNGETLMVECRIDERRYRVADGYKFTLESASEIDDVNVYVTTRHFYQCDFDRMRERNPDDFKIYILVDHDAKYERFRG